MCALNDVQFVCVRKTNICDGEGKTDLYTVALDDGHGTDGPGAHGRPQDIPLTAGPHGSEDREKERRKCICVRTRDIEGEGEKIFLM